MVPPDVEDLVAGYWTDGTFANGWPPSDANPGVQRKTRVSNGVVIGIAVALIVAAIVTIPHVFGQDSRSPGAQQLATASIQSFPVTVNANGAVVPASEEAVAFTTGGQLSQIDVRVGQTVTRGPSSPVSRAPQPQIDVAKAQAAVAAADAALQSAQSPLQPGRSAQLQAAVQSAQVVYSGTVASVGSTASEDAAVVAADKQKLSVDQNRLATDGCSTWQPTNALICQDDQSAISGDQGRISVDEARTQSDAANGKLREAQASASVTRAEEAAQSQGTPSPSGVAKAQAGVQTAQAQLKAAQAELSALTLVAPNSGTVLEVNGQVGETVTGSPTGAATLPGTSAPIPAVTSSSGSTLSPGAPPLIMIGSTKSFVVGAAFSASDVGQLVPGQHGTITADVLGGVSIPCHVLAVASDATNVNNSAVVYVSVIPDASMSKLSSGLPVTVSVGVARANAVIAVPQSAVYLVSGLPYVEVWNGRRAVPTAVTTGLQGTDMIEVTSGLSQGEQVVLSAYQGLPGSGSSADGP